MGFEISCLEISTGDYQQNNNNNLKDFLSFVCSQTDDTSASRMSWETALPFMGSSCSQC